MDHRVTLLLDAIDDDALRAAIDRVGGLDRARKLLVDYARMMEHGGSLDDFVLLIAAFDRVDEISRSHFVT
jgi:hypothetical protein